MRSCGPTTPHFIQTNSPPKQWTGAMLFCNKCNFPWVLRSTFNCSTQTYQRKRSETLVRNTAVQLAFGKAPGPDGFAGEFYKTLSYQISALLAQYYNSVLTSDNLRPETKNAFIKVLPEPGKDPLCPGSYHFISLID